MHSTFKKTLVSSAVTGALLVGTAGFSTAQAELEFNVGVFTDYILYGKTESGNNAVVQGGIDWGHESGFYLGTWASTLGDGEGQEVDFYAGYAFEAGGLDVDLGYIYYYYPGENAPLDDFGDIFVTVGSGPLYATLKYTIHDSDAEGSYFAWVGGDVEVMPSISLNGELGRADIDDGDSWTFWSLGLTKSTGIGDISFTYAQNNDDEGDDPLFVAGYSISF